MRKCLMILFFLFGFSLSSQNNLITNSSFDTAIGDYAGINGASDEWFTINGDPNIAQTAGTIHLKSNNSANAIVRYKLDPTKFTAGKSYKLLFDAIALGIDTDLTKGLTFQVRKASDTGNNNSNVYFWYEADSQTGPCFVNGALYSASVNKGQAVSSWGTPSPWSSRGGANFTIPNGTDLSFDPMILTFVYNKETNAPADAASGWYLDNVSITEIPADPDGVIVEDGSMDSHNRSKSAPMPYTTNFWIQTIGAVQVFADRDADNNITQTAVMVAAKGSAGGGGIARKLINNLTVNTDYVLKFKIKATEGKTYTKGANIRMKTNNANGNNLDALSTSITVADFNGAASDPAVDFIQKEHAFNSLNNTELVINFYHGNETDAAFDGTYVYLDDFIVEEAAAADTTPPVITLVGDNPVNITVGDTYTDAGATASDDVDGDITTNIVTVNNVDATTIGTYTVTYNVSDAAGNPATEVTRTVNVTAQTYNITFTVDMSAQTEYDGTTPISLAGSFTGWDLANSHTLSDNGDGTHSVTIPLEDGNYTYTFLVGNDWPGAETIAENTVCSVRSGESINRRLIVSGEDATHANPYNGCSGTGETYDLKFILDMTSSGVEVNDNIYLSGSFNGFNDSTAFTESDTPGVYEVWTSIAEGTYTWKARMGNWAAQEAFAAANNSWEALVNDPHAGIVTNGAFTDRVLTIDRDMTVSVAWSTPTPTISAYESQPVSAALDLVGVMDFSITSSGGKGLHFVATANIADLTTYSYNVYSNGSTSPSLKLFPAGSASAGDHILLAYSPSAMDTYMDASNIFDVVIENTGFTGNGDDVVELLFDGNSIETYGTIGVDGSGTAWNGDGFYDYLDSWAYQENGVWTAGAANCTDGTMTTWDSTCIYPFAVGKQPIDTTAPVITLLGDDPVAITVGDAYVDAGATATDDVDGDITANIVTVNNVDVNNAAQYIITYNVSDAAGNAAAEVTRTVNVNDPVDTTPPDITLIGDNPVNITVGDTYTDAGATATDDVDGDITANIVVGGDIVDVNNAAQYIITYNVSDAAGNAAAEVTRTVNVNDPVDTTPPDITLIGDAVVELNVGDTYNEEGATATDNVDGDISANIVIGGDTVDTNTAGQYIVTYNVSDAAMNAATEVTRTVNVNEEVEPCANANATAQPAADFDNDSVDIRLWKEDSSSYEIVDGASETSLAGNTVGGTGNIMKYIDTGGQYANVQMVTCAKFDLENSHGKFTLKAYIDSGSLTVGSPNQLELKLQNSELGGDTWTTQVGIIKAIDQLDTWVELEFDFSLDGATVARTDLDQVVIQFNSENNNDNVTAYLDDIATSVGAGPIAETEPATAAPSPDEDATTDNVVSILSAHYAPFRDITNNNLDPWGDAEWSSVELNGETLWRYENLNYQGHDIGTWDGMTLVDGADVSASTHVHFDAWTENGDVVDFYILDFDDGPGNEAFTSVTTTAGAWSEHEVKLDDFNTIEAFDGTLRQLKITRNEANNAANISNLYLTNIYFYTDQSLTTVDRNLGALKVFPNPTQNQWTIQAEKNIESVRVFDVLGKEVMHVKPFSNAVNIDASKLRDGVYFASINDVKTVRIIKQ